MDERGGRTGSVGLTAELAAFSMPAGEVATNSVRSAITVHLGCTHGLASVVATTVVPSRINTSPVHLPALPLALLR